MPSSHAAAVVLRAAAIAADGAATDRADASRAPLDRRRAERAWQRLEREFDRLFGAVQSAAPLGALGFLFFWWLVASGIYLYAALDTSAPAPTNRSRGSCVSRGTSAAGCAARTATPPTALSSSWCCTSSASGRSAASAPSGATRGGPAFPPAVRVRERHRRLLVHWDRLGQFSAEATAEWLDALPLFAASLSRNFVNVAAVGDRLFSLFVFVHVGVPLLMLFGLWFHVQRIAHAEVLPPRRLALATTTALLALALLVPVASHPPADLSTAPGALALDWYLLFVHPLVDATSARFVWTLLAGATLLLLLLPLLPQRSAATAPPARVDPANCNGCRRCFVDCPHTAITMVPHPHWQTAGRPLRQLAQVDPDLCASCGICVGACPSSTPFRSGAALVTGIDMPQRPIDALRRELDTALAAGAAGARSSCWAAPKHHLRRHSARRRRRDRAWSAPASCRRRSSTTRSVPGHREWS
jgi:Heterodisulfide reductase, subunit A and related polyferredoxins